MALGDIAAELRLPVFPCADNKQPLVAGGFKAASDKPAQIRAAFERPGAVLIGMPTGQRSGLVVVDIDIRPGHTGMTWLAENRDALPQTRTHKTRSGGLHLLFRAPEGVEIRNSASRIAPGVDVRGEGGYVVIPPSPGYAMADDTEPADMPRWLIRLCLPPERTAASPRPVERREISHGGTRYGLAALSAECDAIRGAPFGKQETTLNEAALKIGALIAGGELEEGAATAELLAAGRAMANEPAREAWTDDEVDAKVRRGLRHGLATPRAAPERPARQQSEPPEPDPGYWDTLAGDPGPEPEPPRQARTELLRIESDDWDEAAIPQRPWIARGYILRGSVTLVAGMGSAGKSSLALAWGIAAVLAVTWSRFRPVCPCRASVYNVEDDDDEQRRRISATLRQFGKKPHDLAGKLFRIGPHNVGTLIERDPQSLKLRLTDAMQQLIAHIEAVRPHILMLDPLVELHNVEENDNTAIRGILATFRALAQRFDMAIVLFHHARKGSASSAGDPDMIRGAGAIVGAARVALTVSTMTEDEAQELSIEPKNRHDFFRVDGAKQNYDRISEAEWFRRASYDLGNGEQVAAPVPWKPPSVWAEQTSQGLNAALDIIGAGKAGQPYAPTRRGRSNSRWAGQVLVDELHVTEVQADQMLKSWLRSGLLVVEEFRDDNRMMRQGVRVDDTKRPT